MSAENLYEHYRKQVENYLRNGHGGTGGFMSGDDYVVNPLAAGEYNLNYLVEKAERKFVFRVNIGTQINRHDQIEYEFRALKLLARSGVTPQPYWVDDTREHIDRGISIMEFLPGRHLDYTKDLQGAARTFAAIHQVEVSDEENHLIVEEAPLSLIYDECSGLLDTYFDANLGATDIKSYLREVIDWADKARTQERYYQEDPYFCIVNTEVNSGNFIVNDKQQSVHLIDWEMPRWGDPSTDLCHFCSPLTTLWKSPHRLTENQYKEFLEEYFRHIRSKQLRDSLPDRMKLKSPFVYLRGISWSAMAWVAYQTEFSGIRNEDTWQTLCRYLDLEFIRSLFDPFLQVNK